MTTHEDNQWQVAFDAGRRGHLSYLTQMTEPALCVPPMVHLNPYLRDSGEARLWWAGWVYVGQVRHVESLAAGVAALEATTPEAGTLAAAVQVVTAAGFAVVAAPLAPLATAAKPKPHPDELTDGEKMIWAAAFNERRSDDDARSCAGMAVRCFRKHVRAAEGRDAIWDKMTLSVAGKLTG
jgi:hypothetical protein